GQHGDATVRFGAGDAPEVRLAREQAALVVEQQSIGSGVLAVDMRFALPIEPANVPVAAGENAQLGMPRGSLAPGAVFGLDLEPGARGEDRSFGQDGG